MLLTTFMSIFQPVLSNAVNYPTAYFRRDIPDNKKAKHQYNEDIQQDIFPPAICNLLSPDIGKHIFRYKVIQNRLQNKNHLISFISRPEIKLPYGKQHTGNAASRTFQPCNFIKYAGYAHVKPQHKPCIYYA